LFGLVEAAREEISSSSVRRAVHSECSGLQCSDRTPVFGRRRRREPLPHTARAPKSSFFFISLCPRQAPNGLSWTRETTEPIVTMNRYKGVFPFFLYLHQPSLLKGGNSGCIALQYPNSVAFPATCTALVQRRPQFSLNCIKRCRTCPPLVPLSVRPIVLPISAISLSIRPIVLPISAVSLSIRPISAVLFYFTFGLPARAA